jgi:predicted nucleic acid binding AN1-type Zn finger protein
MNTLIAACGLDCVKCDSYVATQANDRVALEKLAEKWRVDYKSPGITAANVLCDGCMAGGRAIGYCKECKIRACVQERGFENCAACPDYACENLAAFWTNAPQAKANLDALR